jgi:hypothetical protein
MVPNPVLLVGGSGVIGQQTAHFLRSRYPQLPLLIGGRDVDKANQVAREVGNAEAVTIDLTAEDLGLGSQPIGGVAVFFMDERMTTLRYALSKRVPYVSISSGIQEMSLEVAPYLHARDAAPVVLGTEWLVGATTLPTLHLATAFKHVSDITVGALVDEQDISGPTTHADLERLAMVLPAALARRDGAYYWRLGDDTPSKIRAIDGTEIDAAPFSAYDVAGLGAATNAANIHFNLASGVTSTRRRGEPPSTEIIIELSGTDHEGQPLQTRHAVFHPEGQRSVTSNGVAMILERVLGLDGKAPPAPGLYFPHQLLDGRHYLDRLREIGGELLELEV